MAMKTRRMIVAMGVLLALVAPRAQAGLATATNSGNWFNTSVWSNGILPVANDDVVIQPGKSVMLSDSPPELASVTNFGTLTFTNWNTTITATVFTVSAGMITHSPCYATNASPLASNRVSIVCSNLTIAAGAVINANGAGYFPAGPGNKGALSRDGAGYGGAGGKGQSASGGPAYGSSNAPTDPGSSGGAQGVPTGGAAGGGAVRIQASGTVTVNGTLSADGLQKIGDNGGGSGGSLYIDCLSIAGNGLIRARGGDAGESSGNSGGGGGGRLALYYAKNDTYYGVPTVAGGLQYVIATNTTSCGKVGTLVWRYTGADPQLTIVGSPLNADSPSPYPYGYSSVPAGTPVTENVTTPADQAAGVRYDCLGWSVKTNGVEFAAGATTQAVFTMPDTNATLTYNWTSVYELVVQQGAGGTADTGLSGWYTNGTVVAITQTAASGYYFSQWTGDVPTNANRNATLSVIMDRPRNVLAYFASETPTTKTWGGTGNWTNGSRWTPAGMPGYLDTAVVTNGVVTLSESVWAGNVTVSNGATMLFTNWNTVLYARDVTVRGTITHPVNTDTNAADGWTPDNGVWIVCTNLTIAAGGSLDVTGKGYAGSVTHGRGPGGGRGDPYPNFFGGGGYGGLGGKAASPWGQTYGSSIAPTDPGSSGGSRSDSPGTLGGNGGGAVRIEASGTVTVNGLITANSPDNQAGGQGSGGSIYIVCQSFAGSVNGIVRANGGYSSDPHYSGTGGGGRIAILYARSDSYYGTVSAAAGSSPTPALRGANGTVYRAFTGTDPLLTVIGNPANNGNSSPYPYGISAVPAAAEVTNTMPSPVDGLAGVKYGCIGWTVTTNGIQVADGSTTQAVFQMAATNMTQTWFWTNQFSLIVTAAPNGTASSELNGFYNSGAQVQIGATADVNYVFSQWTGDVPSGGHTNNPLTVTMDRSRVIRANFASVTPETKTWTGTGNWVSPANWSPAGMPGPADSVIVQSGIVTLGDPTWAQSVTVANAATLLMSNWIAGVSAPEIVVEGGGVVTCAACDTNTVPSNTNRVYLICSNLTVLATGAINADRKGYLGGNKNGQGPGAGFGGDYPGMFGGAGYGGNGGQGGNGAAGLAYGSASEPEAPGSGGGGRNDGNLGGAGGGAIRIVATGHVLVNGSVTADGQSIHAGEGSGGGIYITCRTFAGTNGVIRAKGGDTMDFINGYEGAGGGGRIALWNNASAQSNLNVRHSVRFSAAKGAHYAPRPSSPGTIYFSDANSIPLVVENGQYMFTHLPGWSAEWVSFSNAVATFPAAFAWRVSNDVSILGSSVVTLINPALTAIGGNLTVTNAALHVYGAPTNGEAGAYGALVEVAGDMNILSNGYVYPHSDPTNGGSVLFRVRNLSISGGTGAGFNAIGAGYAATLNNGYGPGFGWGGSSSPYGMGNAASYGGLGGKGGYNGNLAGVGVIYGSSNAPVDAGSAGGGGNGVGGNGGGVVAVEASKTVTLNGLITADGGTPPTYNSNAGCGSGGSIYIRCRTFAGTSAGVLRANGGDNSGSVNNGGGGGGGRIAVWRLYDTTAGAVTAEVRGGTHTTPACVGQSGTVVWGQVKATGTIMVIR
jgi:hypothetical protein